MSRFRTTDPVKALADVARTTKRVALTRGRRQRAGRIYAKAAAAERDALERRRNAIVHARSLELSNRKIGRAARLDHSHVSRIATGERT
jgi:hypothetical protein